MGGSIELSTDYRRSIAHELRAMVRKKLDFDEFDVMRGGETVAQYSKTIIFFLFLNSKI